MAVQLHKPVVCPVVIGRAHDLAILHALIDEAKNGKEQVLLISGEAGIGKSRLVSEAKTYATQSMSILQGNCFESDQSYPYRPLHELHLPRNNQDAVQQRIERLSEASNAA